MAAEAPAQVPQRAIDAAETTDVMQVFDALATDGAVKQKEFAVMIQLEAKAVVRKMIMSQVEAMAAAGDEADLPVHQKTIKTMIPVIKRSFDRFDAAHMRTLLEMLFRVMDGNQNGKIEKAEFEEFFKTIGELFMAPDPEKVGDFAFKLVDKNGNGKLSLDEAQTLIDSLVEILGTIIASVADVAESIICAPEAADAIKNEIFMQMKDEGITPGDLVGECSKTEQMLKPGADWYHKKDTDEDLCKAEYDKYTGDDKGEYFLVDTPEKLKGDKKYRSYCMDPNAMLSRDEVEEQLKESGIIDGIKAVFADGSQQGPKAQMVNAIKAGREALGRAESNVGAQFYMKAMEWSQGGVDEATFLCQMVPMMRESQDKEMEKLKAHPAEELKKMFNATSANTPPQAAAMIEQVIEQLVESGELVPAFERGQKRAQEFNAEYARTLFRFLDLDSSGRITTQEIRLLKALMDAMLHLGERAVHEMEAGELKPMEGSVEDNAKELAFAIFDILDKDGDGKMSLNELVFFFQKLMMFILEGMKFGAHAILECVYDELFKAFASIGWKKAGLEEVGKDQIMQGVMMAPMMVPMMMMQMQGGM